MITFMTMFYPDSYFTCTTLLTLTEYNMVQKKKDQDHIYHLIDKKLLILNLNSPYLFFVEFVVPSVVHFPPFPPPETTISV